MKSNFKSVKMNEMRIIYVLIFMSFFLIGLMFYNEGFKHLLHEGMTSDTNKTIVLIGDSILKNNVYVGKGKSVEDLLTDQYNGNVINLAKDNSTVKDMYDQVKELPVELNDKSTTIFVSIGGNDILNKYVVVNDANLDDFKNLYEIYLNYKYVFKKLRDRCPNAKIIIMNLYYPQSVKYLKYREVIKKWNDLLFEYQNDPINKVNDILDLSLVMNDKKDFALCIEPSEQGSIKIVREILVLSNE